MNKKNKECLEKILLQGENIKDLNILVDMSTNISAKLLAVTEEGLFENS